MRLYCINNNLKWGSGKIPLTEGKLYLKKRDGISSHSVVVENDRGNEFGYALNRFESQKDRGSRLLKNTIKSLKNLINK